MFDIPQNAGPVEFNTAAIELEASLDNMLLALGNVLPDSQVDEAMRGLKSSAMWAATVIHKAAENWPVPVDLLPEPIVAEEELLADADAHAEVYPNIAEGSNG